MARFLLFDCQDSFTYNIYSLVLSVGHECRVVSSLQNETVWELEPWDLAIIGPGPGQPSTAGHLMKFLLTYYHKKPILGICLGHQGIGCFAGASLVEARQPMHGKQSQLVLCESMKMIIAESGAQIDFIKPLSVMRYHSLVLSKVPPLFIPLAFAVDDGSLQMMKHQDLPIWGMQFHPESIKSPGGSRLIELFVHNSGIL